MKVKRTYRLSQKTVDQLAELAERERITATEALERAVEAFCEEPDEPDGSQTQNQLIEVLTSEINEMRAQIAIKDGQIDLLGRALAEAQAATKAAQTLHAAATKTLALDEPKGRFARAWKAWRG